MYTVYVLQGEHGKSYKGFTNNLARRFSEHARGKTRTTKNMQRLSIVYTEQVPDRMTARKRELYLKSAAGRRFLKLRL